MGEILPSLLHPNAFVILALFKSDIYVCPLSKLWESTRSLYLYTCTLIHRFNYSCVQAATHFLLKSLYYHHCHQIATVEGKTVRLERGRGNRDLVSNLLHRQRWFHRSVWGKARPGLPNMACLLYLDLEDYTRTSGQTLHREYSQNVHTLSYPWILKVADPTHRVALYMLSIQTFKCTWVYGPYEHVYRTKSQKVSSVPSAYCIKIRKNPRGICCQAPNSSILVQFFWPSPLWSFKSLMLVASIHWINIAAGTLHATFLPE